MEHENFFFLAQIARPTVKCALVSPREPPPKPTLGTKSRRGHAHLVIKFLVVWGGDERLFAGLTSLVLHRMVINLANARIFANVIPSYHCEWGKANYFLICLCESAAYFLICLCKSRPGSGRSNPAFFIIYEIASLRSRRQAALRFRNLKSCDYPAVYHFNRDKLGEAILSPTSVFASPPQADEAIPPPTCHPESRLWSGLAMV